MNDEKLQVRTYAGIPAGLQPIAAALPAPVVPPAVAHPRIQPEPARAILLDLGQPNFHDLGAEGKQVQLEADQLGMPVQAWWDMRRQGTVTTLPAPTRRRARTTPPGGPGKKPKPDVAQPVAGPPGAYVGPLKDWPGLDAIVHKLATKAYWSGRARADAKRGGPKPPTPLALAKARDELLLRIPGIGADGGIAIQVCPPHQATVSETAMLSAVLEVCKLTRAFLSTATFHWDLDVRRNFSRDDVDKWLNLTRHGLALERDWTWELPRDHGVRVRMASSAAGQHVVLRNVPADLLVELDGAPSPGFYARNGVWEAGEHAEDFGSGLWSSRCQFGAAEPLVTWPGLDVPVRWPRRAALAPQPQVPEGEVDTARVDALFKSCYSAGSKTLTIEGIDAAGLEGLSPATWARLLLDCHGRGIYRVHLPTHAGSAAIERAGRALSGLPAYYETASGNRLDRVLQIPANRPRVPFFPWVSYGFIEPAPDPAEGSIASRRLWPVEVVDCEGRVGGFGRVSFERSWMWVSGLRKEDTPHEGIAWDDKSREGVSQELGILPPELARIVMDYACVDPALAPRLARVIAGFRATLETTLALTGEPRWYGARPFNAAVARLAEAQGACDSGVIDDAIDTLAGTAFLFVPHAFPSCHWEMEANTAGLSLMELILNRGARHALVEHGKRAFEILSIHARQVFLLAGKYRPGAIEREAPPVRRWFATGEMIVRDDLRVRLLHVESDKYGLVDKLAVGPLQTVGPVAHPRLARVFLAGWKHSDSSLAAAAGALSTMFDSAFEAPGYVGMRQRAAPQVLATLLRSPAGDRLARGLGADCETFSIGPEWLQEGHVDLLLQILGHMPRLRVLELNRMPADRMVDATRLRLPAREGGQPCEVVLRDKHARCAFAAGTPVAAALPATSAFGGVVLAGGVEMEPRRVDAAAYLAPKLKLQQAMSQPGARERFLAPLRARMRVHAFGYALDRNMHDGVAFADCFPRAPGDAVDLLHAMSPADFARCWQGRRTASETIPKWLAEDLEPGPLRRLAEVIETGRLLFPRPGQGSIELPRLRAGELGIYGCEKDSTVRAAVPLGVRVGCDHPEATVEVDYLGPSGMPAMRAQFRGEGVAFSSPAGTQPEWDLLAPHMEALARPRVAIVSPPNGVNLLLTGLKTQRVHISGCNELTRAGLILPAGVEVTLDHPEASAVVTFVEGLAAKTWVIQGDPLRPPVQLS